uniref:Elongation of very long chain fatty acids protein n=1 Tax=Strongyloides venezuelensis TaxID=75913 RepID=A0A0K0G462_STRVS
MILNLLKDVWPKIILPPDFNGKEFLRILLNPKFSKNDALKWTEERIPFTLQIAILYLIAIFGIQRIMKNYTPFKLTIPLAIWNLTLTVYSVISVYHLSSDFFKNVGKFGIRKSWCVLGNYYDSENTGYYVWLFAVSKLFELIDTIFIVLRKKPLRFIHWYHHIVTLTFTFFIYIEMPAFSRWGFLLNSFVHSIMYFYYFVKCLTIRIPKFISIIITSSQIAQFAIGFCGLINVAYIHHYTNMFCHTTTSILSLTLFMDFTYLLLFVNFFIQTYFKNTVMTRKKKQH